MTPDIGYYLGHFGLVATICIGGLQVYLLRRGRQQPVTLPAPPADVVEEALPVERPPAPHPAERIIYRTVIAPTVEEGDLYARLAELQREIGDLESLKEELEEQVEDLRDTEEFTRRDLRELRVELRGELAMALEDHSSVLRGAAEEAIMTFGAVVDRYRTSLDDLLESLPGYETPPAEEDPPSEDPKTTWDHLEEID
jgi:hypothetical protein